MVRRPPTPSTLAIVGALSVATVVWTWLAFSWAPLRALDARVVGPTLAPGSPTAQVAGAFALLTWPGLEYAAIAGIAIWAAQRRLRQLAVALVLVVVIAWGGAVLAKYAFRRTRPERALDLLTANGFSYPSGHLVSAVACTIAVGVTFAVTRQSLRARTIWAVGAGLLVLVTAVDRWLLGAHYVTDLVGGLLYGGFAATAAFVIAGVKVPAPHEIVGELVRPRTPPLPAATDAPRPRAAIIYNPVKVTDWVTFRRHVEYELRSRDWDRPLWLETTIDDPGRAMTAQAVAERVDLVLGAGGDGTIRVICAGLADTGIPFGLIPAGTGNLLAKNIGIPLDEGAALEVAFEGVDKAIDLVALSIDGGEPDLFAVMAGVGIDAVIMDSTRPELKKAVGSAAYFVAAAQNTNHPALAATITLDDQPPFKRKAHVIVVGNVGLLQANIQLIPDAKPDDGLLDVLIASPRTPRDWARLITQVLTRRRHDDAQLDRLRGRRVHITVEPRDHYQMDGDTAGDCGSFTAEIRPGALILRTPRGVRRSGLPSQLAVAPVTVEGGDEVELLDPDG